MSLNSSSGGAHLPDEIRPINIGLQEFAEAVRIQGAEVVRVDWRVPAGGRRELIAALGRAYGPRGAAISEANREVVRRLDQSSAFWTGVLSAGECIPNMGERTILHPGPPLSPEELCDPLRRSVRAAITAEGWSSSPEEADRLLENGEVELRPANHHNTVLPMASALGPSSPAIVVENPDGQTKAYTGINQGPGKRAWFGVDQPEAVQNLLLLRDVISPLLDKIVREGEPLDVFAVISQALLMGDDAHMRSQAATNLAIRFLLPQLADLNDPRTRELADFLSGNHLFFLNLSMAGAKAAATWAAQVEGSTVVSTMARNGTTFGIQVAGENGRWFIAEAPPVEDALYRGDFSSDEAARDIGDSAILELVGLGGAAAAASPSLAAFRGGSMADAATSSEDALQICVDRSSRFKLPYLDFGGSPIGVDVRQAVELQTTPSINTGILSRSGGHGQIGAGVARAPLECFEKALLALDEASPISGDK